MIKPVGTFGLIIVNALTQGKFKTFLLSELAGLTDPGALFRGIFENPIFTLNERSFGKSWRFKDSL